MEGDGDSVVAPLSEKSPEVVEGEPEISLASSEVKDLGLKVTLSLSSSTSEETVASSVLDGVVSVVTDGAESSVLREFVKLGGSVVVTVEDAKLSVVVSDSKADGSVVVPEIPETGASVVVAVPDTMACVVVVVEELGACVVDVDVDGDGSPTSLSDVINSSLIMVPFGNFRTIVLFG